MIEQRLQELGIILPPATAAIAAYVPFVITGNLLIISGQLPLHEGKLLALGQLGHNVDLETAQAAARQCAINVLAQIKSALGSLNHVKRVVRLGGFISATPDFTNHAAVMNGASSVMEAVFAERGRHARSTIGVASLPLGAAVEVEALIEIEA